MALNYSIIGMRLKQARIDKKLTQEKLAEELDVSVAYVSRVERGSTEIGLKRPAGPVQYSEAIFAFCDYLTLDEVLDLDIQNQIFVLLPKVVDQLCNLVNMKDGSAPSKKVIKWVNFNSIRWGNGPVFQAIMMYLSIYDMVNKDRNEDDGNY